MTDRTLRNHFRRFGERDGDTVQSLFGAKSEIEFQHRRIGGDLLALRGGRDETRSGQHFEAFVDTDEELGRNNGALDRAELRAFDLTRDRTQLARRIDLDLDAAPRILFDGGAVHPCILIERRIESGRRDLHHERLVLRVGCTGCQCQ